MFDRLTRSMAWQRAIMVGVIVIPIFVLTIAHGLKDRDAARLDAQADALRFAQIAADEYRDEVGRARLMLGRFAMAAAASGGNGVDLRACRLIYSSYRGQGLIQNLVLISADGAVLCSAGPTMIGSFPGAHRAVLEAVETGAIAVTRRQSADVGSAPPVMAERVPGRKQIIAIAELASDPLGPIAMRLRLPSNFILAVIADNGRIILRHPDPDFLVGLTAAGTAGFEEMQRKPFGYGLARGLDSVSRLYAWQRTSTGRGRYVYMSAAARASEVYGAAYRSLWNNLLMLVLITVASMSVTIALSRWFFTRRLANFTQVAERIEQGDLSARVNLDRVESPVHPYAIAVNRMADELEVRRKQEIAERESLIDSAGRLTVLANSIPHVVWSTDPQGGTNFRSEQWEAYTGHPASEPWMKAIPLNDRAWAEEKFLSSLETGEPFSFELKVTHHTGEARWNSVHATPVHDDAGQIVRWYGSVTDVHDLHETFLALHESEKELRALTRDLESQVGERTSELETLNRKLQVASSNKSRFLAEVSHEVRTPLNAIIGFTQVVIDQTAGPVSATQKEYLNDVLNAAEHLLALVDDLLDVSKVEAGNVTIDAGPVDIGRLIEDVCREFRTVAAHRRILIVEKVSPKLGRVYVDEKRVRQILSNYLSNAVKFSPPGSTVVVSAQAAGEGEFALEVTDTGRGIAELEMHRLFQEYERLGDRADDVEGNGLGLAVTKRLVTAHGGRVGVRSIEGEGSTFSAVLPLDARRSA